MPSYIELNKILTPPSASSNATVILSVSPVGDIIVSSNTGTTSSIVMESASYATTASYSMNGGGTFESSSYSTTASFASGALFSESSSFASGALFSKSSSFASGALFSESSSYAEVSYTAISSSFAHKAISVNGNIACTELIIPTGSWSSVNTGSMYYSSGNLWIYTGTPNNFGAGLGWSSASVSF